MSWNPVWEEIFSSREWGKYPPEDLIRFIARNFYKSKNRSEIKILEIGSGTGSNMWYLAREGFNVSGIEGSKTGVSIAKERIVQDLNIKEHNVHIIQGDICNLPYDNSIFDAVIDIETIYTNSWRESLKIINEVNRVLKPNGKFYSKHFAKDSYGDKTGKYVEKHMYIPSEGVLEGTGQARFATEQDIIELYGKYFEIVELEQNIRTVNSREKMVIEWLISMVKKDDPSN